MNHLQLAFRNLQRRVALRGSSRPPKGAVLTTTVAKVCLGSKAHIDVGYAHVGQVPIADTRRPSARTSALLAFPAARIAI